MNVFGDINIEWLNKSSTISTLSFLPANFKAVKLKKWLNVIKLTKYWILLLNSSILKLYFKLLVWKFDEKIENLNFIKKQKNQTTLFSRFISLVSIRNSHNL